ncbi:MAG: hypothetical protein L3J39_10575 [Verrucomicrobiales bacterium]|nr:hypothetical protein [Verrucomicrobiales bacterium]
MPDATDNPLQDTLIKIGSEAERRALPYLLVGGNAVICYGIIRMTRDIDFLVPDTALNDWRAFLETLGYHCYHATSAFCQFEPRSSNRASVDLMIVDASTWAKLFAKAERKPITKTYAPHLPAAIHLIAMKLKASQSPHRRKDAQDWNDIVKIIQKLEINIKEPDVSELIIRYGGVNALIQLEKDLS